MIYIRAHLVLCVVDPILRPHSILDLFCWAQRDIQYYILYQFRIALRAPYFVSQLMPINNMKLILRVFDFHIIILVLSKSVYIRETRYYATNEFISVFWHHHNVPG